MTLYDHTGAPIPEGYAVPQEVSCPCGSKPEDITVVSKGFGGYHKKICKRCGNVIEAGRDIVVEGGERA